MSAMEGGMCRDTAKRYVEAGKLPSEMQKERDWRTRQDPFEEVWEEVEGFLEDLPELEAKTLFEHLRERHPGKFADGQLRTLQRRVRHWRATRGPAKEVYFGQRHEVGKTMQLDWMHTGSLGLTIQGRSYEPLLCHCVMQYSKWEWATTCSSESYLSLQRTVQEGCLRLGGVPIELVTDNSSAATHRIEAAKSKRKFNDAYDKLLNHYGLRGRTTNLGCPHENGSVESMHGHLRRRLKQALLLRGHADFADEEAFVRFLQDQLNKANGNRVEKVREEQHRLEALPTPLPNHQSVTLTVGSGATVNVKKSVYSVPSQLIGHKVEIRIHQDELEVRLGSELVCRRPRVPAGGCGVDYRDLVAQMLRKPGAFAGYRWREAFFPRPLFRELYDALKARGMDAAAADLEYLRILNRAAEHGEERVAGIVRDLLDQDRLPSSEALDDVLNAKPEIPHVDSFIPDSAAYDLLFEGMDGGSDELAS